MSKVSKFTIIGLIILLGVNTVVLTMVYKDSEEKYDNLKSRYQMKNDSGFAYILKNAVSLIPLAETLEDISNTAKDQSPAKVQQLIETAKTEAEQIDEQILTLIEFSDDYSKDNDQGIVVNNSAMISEEQYEMFGLAFSGVWSSVRTISFYYWKSSPKVIDEGTREYLRSMASELRSIDEILSMLKEEYTTSFNSFSNAKYAKAQLVSLLKPHLIKLDKMQEAYFSNLTPVSL
ncbi:hypothetical protein J45TS6_24660 [Paenibacillus sp. J45TS6]|uniref:hypothetical protein n=1 Tax=Paenibacillus sp. J45TS6 TaxID=2807196 RepID=UPI001B1ABD31|nr:hypothetical protein [Paenibacillus sp. J45TS6]GIP44007.1 hypothetical protein J45TS6_24660 [Paenibacillus sp. J45TS6]